MRSAIIVAGLMAWPLLGAFGQAAEENPTFDVASVKPSQPQTGPGMRVMMRGGPGTPDPGQLTYTNVSLQNILQNAYDVKSYQISGPGWLGSERYDIAAKIPQGATKEQFRKMLQNLLAERFKLTLHRETKELPIYALVVGKNGSKLKETPKDTPAAGGAPPPGGGRMKLDKDGRPQMPPMGKGSMRMMFHNGNQELSAVGMKLSGLADMLSGQLGRPVVDQTGLTGEYDFTLECSPENMVNMGPMPPPPPGAAPVMVESSAPPLPQAIQEQLGLKLEAKKGPVELLVIDHAEKVPTEN
jgi:uncharacterized protein (TIGR03435 family)